MSTNEGDSLKEGEFLYLSVDEISVNPLRPRASINRNSLIELADSIRKYGILTPLLVALTPAGYQVIAGERRLRAARLAGFTKVPAIVKKVEPSEMGILALVENIQREQLAVFEQAATIQRLQVEHNLDLQEIGERVGLSVKDLEKRLELLKLPDKIKEAMLAKKISDQEAFKLAASKDPDLILEELEKLEAG